MTPHEHYIKAEELIDFDPGQYDTTFAALRIRQAHVHAVLAQTYGTTATREAYKPKPTPFTYGEGQ